MSEDPLKGFIQKVGTRIASLPSRTGQAAYICVFTMLKSFNKHFEEVGDLDKFMEIMGEVDRRLEGYLPLRGEDFEAALSEASKFAGRDFVAQAMGANEVVKGVVAYEVSDDSGAEKKDDEEKAKIRNAIRKELGKYFSGSNSKIEDKQQSMVVVRAERQLLKGVCVHIRLNVEGADQYAKLACYEVTEDYS